MKIKTVTIILLVVSVILSLQSSALERSDIEFKVFQFPSDMMPRIDGDTSDWDMVPAEYAIGTDQIKDTVRNTTMDSEDLDVTVRVGWVKGMNKLYFLYEAYDDYWDFKHPNLHNDIFEIVLDADLSGGPLIPLGLDEGPFEWSDSLSWVIDQTPESDQRILQPGTWSGYTFHGVHAQNYHIFTPPGDKHWAMVWGCQPWIQELPWSNAAYSYNFQHGESGNLVLEFWITPFDYAPYEGPSRAVVSKLVENSLIGLSWSIIDYDDDSVEFMQYDAFSNLSQKTSMFGNASDLVAFRLMPIEESLRKPIEVQWSFKIVDMDRRIVSFTDESYGDITEWLWDFGDGSTSTEQHTIHQYKNSGLNHVVILEVKGPAGEKRLSKVWDVAVK